MFHENIILNAKYRIFFVLELFLYLLFFDLYWKKSPKPSGLEKIQLQIRKDEKKCSRSDISNIVLRRNKTKIITIIVVPRVLSRSYLSNYTYINALTRCHVSFMSAMTLWGVETYKIKARCSDMKQAKTRWWLLVHLQTVLPAWSAVARG